ncbi:MAG: hypothetical protein KYX60_15910, partial [Halomonas meridiana]|nr:hypothetical protein [Halomonas meridiana]
NGCLLKAEVFSTPSGEERQTPRHEYQACSPPQEDYADDTPENGETLELIKVDRAFVRDILASEDDRAIVESIVFLAKKFARPVPAEALPQWLITWQREGFPDAS